MLRRRLDLDRYIEEKPDKYVKIQNIVIIDDYCGSGESLKTFIENHSEQLRGKTIYYLVTYFMQEAMPLIDETSRQHEVTIEVIYINSGKRAFEYNAFSERKDELRPLIKRRSKKLNIPGVYCLGKYKSEYTTIWIGPNCRDAMISKFSTGNAYIGLYHIY